MYYWVSSYSLFSLNCKLFELVCNALIIGTVHICVAAVLPTQHIDNHFILISKATHTHVAGGDGVHATAIPQGAFNNLLLINNILLCIGMPTPDSPIYHTELCITILMNVALDML